MMQAPESHDKFSLLGGPLHRAGRRLGLVRDNSNSVALGFALGVPLWVVLILLAQVGGVEQTWSLAVLGAHLRLLVVIPLLFVCESLLDPRVTKFVGALVRSGCVRAADLPQLESIIARSARWRDSWVPEVVLLLLIVALTTLLP